MEKSKREEAAELSEKGMSMREISNELGISYNTVYGWLRKPKSGKAGDNADRHLCRTCQYSMGSYRKSNAGMNCNYIGITGKKATMQAGELHGVCQRRKITGKRGINGRKK